MHSRIYILLFLWIPLSVSYGYHRPENDLVRVGKSFMTRYDFAQAVFFFTRAIEENPNLAEAYVYRAHAYLVLNKYQEAVDDYQVALELDPAFVEKFVDSKKESIHTGSYLPSPGSLPDETIE